MRSPVGAGLLAMDSSTPRLTGSYALSLTTIASKPAPTGFALIPYPVQLNDVEFAGASISPFLFLSPGFRVEQKKPRNQMGCGVKNWLVAANQRSSVESVTGWGQMQSCAARSKLEGSRFEASKCRS